MATHRAQTKARVLRLLPLCLLFSCSPGKVEELPVVLAADPPYLLRGEAVVTTLTSLEKFFTADVNGPIESEGGLVIESITRDSDTRAFATVSSAADTVVGDHRYTFDLDGEVAELTLSVLEEQPGPGTVSAEGNTATAGARQATLEIHGEGTSFDSLCTVHVEGADGFHVEMTDVVSTTLVEVRYSIDRDQSSTEATVVVTDGLARYEVPFTIVSPASFETTIESQWLERGRVGWIGFASSNASLTHGTYIPDGEDQIESGEVDLLDSTEAWIPVRVPFDYESDYVVLEASTYTQGGAFLETITAEVEILEPAYIVAVPSLISQSPGQQSVELLARGTDLSGLESVEMDGPEGVGIADWLADDATSGTLTFDVADGAHSGEIFITADDGRRLIPGLVGIPPFGHGAWEAEIEIPRGDRVLLPVVVYGGVLLEDTIEVTEDSGVDVVGWEYIDEGCLVVDVAVETNASEGFRTLVLTSDQEYFDINFEVVESGI
ncbi:MAG: hypothetical protein R6V85_21395 [Polyangia bacterium]